MMHLNFLANNFLPYLITFNLLNKFHLNFSVALTSYFNFMNMYFFLVFNAIFLWLIK